MESEPLSDNPLHRKRAVRVELLSTPEAIISALRRSGGVVGEHARKASINDLDTTFRGHDLLEEIDSLLEQNARIDGDTTTDPASPQATS